MEETNASGRKESEYGSSAQLISNEYQQNVQRKHWENAHREIIQGTDSGRPKGHYTKLKMDTNKTTLIVYDDRAKDAKLADSSDIKS